LSLVYSLHKEIEARNKKLYLQAMGMEWSTARYKREYVKMTAAKFQRPKEPQSPPPTHLHYCPSPRKKRKKKSKKKIAPVSRDLQQGANHC
jgi:hypothetical protein